MSDTGDVEIELVVFGEELNAVFHKGDKVYVYPVEDIEKELDRLVPGWYSVYSQVTSIDEEDFFI